MKFKYTVLAVLHFFVGAGALLGGGAAILNPVSPLGFPLEALEHTPFTNFLIPGLILFIIIGVGSLFSGAMAVLKSEYQGYYSSFSSWALMIFIAVQCLFLRAVVFAHIFYFLIGFAGALLAFCILSENEQFPTAGIRKFLLRK